MNLNVSVSVRYDNATPLLRLLNTIALDPDVRRKSMESCRNLVVNYVRGLPANKQGWPSIGFWSKVEVGGEVTPDGFTLSLENPEAPGAMAFKHRAFITGSGTITMKDKYLTIPARAEYYGHRAGEFTNLRLVVFRRSGAMALAVGPEGEGKLSQNTGKLYNRAGLGAGSTRTGLIIAYWLKASVTQHPDYDVVPPHETIVSEVDLILRRAFFELRAAMANA